MQLQIRSADEPMTTFYRSAQTVSPSVEESAYAALTRRCVNPECAFQWREQ